MTRHEAALEAAKREWRMPILHLTNSGVYAVGGRKDGKFQFGASRQGWAEAFKDADKRAGSK